MEVLLREYVDELRGQILAGHYSDAFNLGQHILHYYPKHIETYRLLGEASLETDDVRGATDLFRRVLSADPENIIALGGLALIFEQQGKLDQSVWHLERAYEIQPMNPELQKELQRIQTAYSGTTAPSPKLTPGALARTHARAGLLALAIEEFRQILGADDQRYDVQVALAETFYKAGQLDHAGKFAESLLADAPYCLKANLLLGVLWSENGVSEGEVLLRRAQEMDPENVTAHTIFGKNFADSPPPRLPGLQAEPRTSPQPSLSTPKSAVTASEYTGTQSAGDELKEFTLTSEENIQNGRLQRGQIISLASATAFLDALERQEEVADKDINELPLSDTMSTGGGIETSAPDFAPSGLGEILAADESQAPTKAGFEIETGESANNKSIDIGPTVLTSVLASASVALGVVETQQKESVSDDRDRKSDTSAYGNEKPSDEPQANEDLQHFRIPGLPPMVRPTIDGAGEKLPAWLYILGTVNTPAPLDSNSESAYKGIPTQELDIQPNDNEANAAEQFEPLKALVVRPSRRSRESLEAAGYSHSEQSPDSTAAAPLTGSPLESVIVPSDQNAKTDELPLQLDPTEIRPTISDASDLTVATVDEGNAQMAPALPSWLVIEEAIRDIGNDLQGHTITPTESAEGWVSAEELEQESVLTHKAENSTRSVNLPPLEPTAQMETATQNQEPATVEVSETTPRIPNPDEPTIEEKIIKPESQGELSSEVSLEDRSAPTSEELLGQARAKCSSGDLTGAIDLYEKVMHRRPNHLDEVTVDLEEIVEQPDAPIAAHRLLGEAYAMAGRFKEALDQYRLALNKQ